MSDQTIPTPQVVGIIHFHGLTLWAVDHQNVEYIHAKPLSDLAGIDWRSAKKTIQEQDNAVLYGSIWLKHPVFGSVGGTSTPSKEGLYLRLDRARMYLARINTKMMRGKGAVEAAETLLNLQIEWAGVLHNYETHGVAAKIGRVDARRKEETSLATLLKTRKETVDGKERLALTHMIHDKLTELGYPPSSFEDDQRELGI